MHVSFYVMVVMVLMMMTIDDVSSDSGVGGHSDNHGGDTDGDDDDVGGNVGGMISWLVYVLPIFYLCSHFPNASLLTAYLPYLRCLSYRYILRQRCALHTFVELKIMR